MNETKTIQIDHVTRVEGHGNIEVQIRNGRVETCRWKVVEAPRFFEAMVRGRKWHEVAHITSRICGICSIGHTLASLKATEAAMGVDITPQAQQMRRLLMHAETIQSHILHVGYLVLPDLLGVPSVIPLAASHREQVLVVVRLHQLANEMSGLIGGRTTHPQRPVVGGFTKWPTAVELGGLRQRLTEARDDLDALVELVFSLRAGFPAFERETEFIALKHPLEYAFYDGEIASTDGGVWPVASYREICNEYLVPQSTAKFARHNRDSYMVGALARVNLNFRQLSPLARRVADMFGLEPVCSNPFMNNVAQVVETAHCIEDAVRIIERLLADQIRDETPEVRVRAGRGIGAVEVPRGILFHKYAYDDRGVCTSANCVIPTNQNHANIQKDFESLVPRIRERPADEIALTLEMLVRAYDPCISCSTHCIFLQGGERDGKTQDPDHR